MENSTPSDPKKLVLPVLIGAAAAGAIAFFLYSDEMTELRGRLSGQIAKKWDMLREKVTDKTEV